MKNQNQKLDAFAERINNFSVQVAEHKPISKGEFENWLRKNYRVESTKRNYRTATSLYLSVVYGNQDYAKHLKVGEVRNWEEINTAMDGYLVELRTGKRLWKDDFLTFIEYLNNHKYAPCYIHLQAIRVKTLFDRMGFLLGNTDHESKNEWKSLCQTLLPANTPLTQDDVLSKSQLRQIMPTLSSLHRAIALVLISGGGRIGETLQLTPQDIDLEKEPAQINIRGQYTKKGVGGRTIGISDEARNAVKEWLQQKPNIGKTGGGTYRTEEVFSISQASFEQGWVKALNRVGLGKRDPTTSVYIYHIHTLRKFYSTRMTMDGMEESLIHAFQGHKGYLAGAYKRFTITELMERYKQHMGAVSITIDDETNGSRTQATVTESELEAWQQLGWTAKLVLPSGKIIVEGKPNLPKPQTATVEPIVKNTLPKITPPPTRVSVEKPSIVVDHQPSSIMQRMPQVEAVITEPLPQPEQPKEEPKPREVFADPHSFQMACARKQLVSLEHQKWLCEDCKERFSTMYKDCRSPYKK